MNQVEPSTTLRAPLHQALDFTGKAVLVTGASDGIGYGIARAFREAGAKVIVTGTRDAGEYERDLSDFEFRQLNCADPQSIISLAASIDETDVLINCVGTVTYGGAEFGRAEFEHVLAVNLSGAMHLCTAFRDRLASRRGSIINLDSVVARTPARNNPAYSASKAGLVHLNKVLAVKWGRLGIRVNGIGPGLVPTKLTSNQLEGGIEERFNSLVPMGRTGAPEDIAGAALFLASPLASYITGHSILVDGGITLVSAF